MPIQLVWRVKWSMDHTMTDQDMTLAQWQQELDPALSLRPPERLLGIPWRHSVAQASGRWERRWNEDGKPPSGSAWPFDAVALAQSQVWMAGQMQRLGCLDGRVRMDTARTGHRVTLDIVLEPGRRRKVGAVTVEDQGSGLSDAALDDVEQAWMPWSGRWLDLDAIDRTRTDIASALQGKGWYGMLSEHVAIDMDTTGSAVDGEVDMHIRLLPASSNGQARPHRLARIGSLTVQWPDSTPRREDVQWAGVLWRTPPGRDVRVLERNLQIQAGDLFQPSALADTRQRLRSLPMAERVDLEVRSRPDSVWRRERALDVVYRVQPAPKQVMRMKGGLTSRQGPGGEVNWTWSQVDFRRRAEEFNVDIQAGLETVTPYLSADSLPETEDPFLNSRVLAAGIEYGARRLIPFGPQRFSRSNRPQSRLSLQWRDEARPKFSRTFIQVGLVEQFIENPGTGSKLEVRPFEIALTASRLQPGFIQELEDLGSGFLTSSFDSRALFASGVSWWLKPPVRPGGIRFRFHFEAEAAGNLFHLIDGRAPEETTIPLPSLFGSSSAVQVARYSRWVLDLRWDWMRPSRNGLHGRLYTGLVASSVPGAAPPLEKQFYVGGPNSLRGWRALGLGPGSAGQEGVNVRGDIRIEVNVEGRHHIRDWIQLAAFVDAGNIWMAREEQGNPGAHFEANRFLREMGVSAGVGLRLDFGYFLLRCDAARPVHWPEGMSPTTSRWRIHPAVSLPF